MTIEIIAELAQGFEGKPEQARLLMKAAAAAGADAAKFQLVYADELATPDYEHYELFRSLEMADEIWAGLATYANELGIQLYVDIFGDRSLRLAEEINLPVVKLHGTDIANIGFLEKVAQSSVPKVLLGAGGAYSSELNRAIDILSDKKVVVLLGFQGYPTPTETNQISRVGLVAKEIIHNHPNVELGFADHATPESPLRYALAATAFGVGARIIEKHLTLGKIMELEDHESALNPDEFSEFCNVLKRCVEAFGETKLVEDFAMSQEERGYRKMIRRHVVAGRDLSVGTILSPSDLVLKRVSAQQVVTDLELAYGKTLKRDIPANSHLTPADIK
ncbi:MAG: N-acetylneuraminate synthase family protein [Desulfotalea sp.]